MHKWPAKRPTGESRRGGRPRGSGTFRNAKQVALALYPYWYKLHKERLEEGEPDPQVSIPEVHDTLEPKEDSPLGPVPPVALSTVRYWLQENNLAWPPAWRPEWGDEPDWNAAANAPKPIPRRPTRRRRKRP